MLPPLPGGSAYTMNLRGCQGQQWCLCCHAGSRGGWQVGTRKQAWFGGNRHKLKRGLALPCPAFQAPDGALAGLDSHRQARQLPRQGLHADRQCVPAAGVAGNVLRSSRYQGLLTLKISMCIQLAMCSKSGLTAAAAPAPPATLRLGAARCHPRSAGPPPHGLAAGRWRGRPAEQVERR